MSDDNKSRNDQKPGKTPPPVVMIPKSFFFLVGAIVVGSFAITLFGRNPYTQSVSEGSSFYETSMDSSAMMWLAIFVGIPASFWAYKTWIIPLFDRK
jgi:hypothetical protein